MEYWVTTDGRVFEDDHYSALVHQEYLNSLAAQRREEDEKLGPDSIFLAAILWGFFNLAIELIFRAAAWIIFVWDATAKKKKMDAEVDRKNREYRKLQEARKPLQIKPRERYILTRKGLLPEGAEEKDFEQLTCTYIDIRPVADADKRIRPRERYTAVDGRWVKENA